MNNVILTGHLTRKIETKQLPTGTIVANFSLGVRRNKDISDFPNLVAFNETAKLLEQYTKQGSLILCVGSLQTRTYTNKNNEKQYITEVLVNRVELLDKKETPKAEGTQNNDFAFKQAEQETQLANEVKDDELPF